MITIIVASVVAVPVLLVGAAALFISLSLSVDFNDQSKEEIYGWNQVTKGESYGE